MIAAELAIRARRAAFNRALADADLHTIEALLAPGVVLVTGTDSAVLTGRKAQLLAWKREFAAPSPTSYVRTAETIVVSSVEPIAIEHGRWQGGGASGAYTAKWRKLAGAWTIEAELYATLA